jgi:hypothetical protein
MSQVERLSVFEFNSIDELCFYIQCEHKKGNSVKFLNEDLEIFPKSDIVQKVALVSYGVLLGDSKDKKDFLRWHERKSGE